MSKYSDLSIGLRESMQITVTPAMVQAYADISTDHNPLHLNPEFAKTTPFGRNIAHGMLSLGFISALQTKMMGNGSVYISQTVKFKAPVFVGDTITANIEIVERIPEKKRIKTRTWCEDQNGKVLLDGEAIIMKQED